MLQKQIEFSKPPGSGKPGSISEFVESKTDSSNFDRHLLKLHESSI